LEEEACHFVLAAFLSFLLGFGCIVARRQCHGSSARKFVDHEREELFDWFRDLGLDVEGVV
jgi:hypothetical protein